VGLQNWFRSRSAASPASPARCAFCADPVAAELDEVAADPANSTYLCRCPVCGQYWGGHGYTPQYRWAFSPQEAAGFFPNAFPPPEGRAEPGAAADGPRL
jgi:hypothetical protein